MKIVKYSGGLIALFVLGLIAVVLMNPVLDYRTQVDIAKAPSDAWDTFMDMDHMGSWMTGFERIEVLSGEPGEVGSEYMLYFRENGRLMTVKETATIMEHGKRYGFDMENEWFDGSALITIEAIASGSRLTIDNTVHGRGLFRRTVLFLMQSKMKERQQGDIEKLRDLIESV